MNGFRVELLDEPHPLKRAIDLFEALWRALLPEVPDIGVAFPAPRALPAIENRGLLVWSRDVGFGTSAT